jgi:hypothetical protein
LAKELQQPNLFYDQQVSSRVGTPKNPSTLSDHENTMFWQDLLDTGTHSLNEYDSTKRKKEEQQDRPKVKETTDFQKIEQDVNEEDIWDFVDQLPKYVREDNDDLDLATNIYDEKSSSSIQSTDSARERPDEPAGKPHKQMSQGEKEWNRLFGITPNEKAAVVAADVEPVASNGNFDYLDERRECYAAINIMDDTSLMGTVLDDTVFPEPSPPKRKSYSTGGTGVR